MREPPLVVDLDGTLLCSDLLLESGLLFVRTHPHRLPQLMQWLARGRAALKQELALATNVDVERLPYNSSVIDLITRERAGGRRIVLATASHQRLAEQVAAHLQLFDEVIATTGDRNLSASAKRDVLVERFGEQGFDYVGNAEADLSIWRSARRAVVVHAAASVERSARALGNVAEVIPAPRATFGEWMQVLRCSHWIKNLLILVPVLTAHQYSDVPSVVRAVEAFIAFSLCASSVYVVNDLLDLRDDRHHTTKKSRPFASGRVSIASGLVGFPLLLLAAFGIAVWRLPPVFTAALAGYYALTLAYSLWLKQKMVIDVIVLAALYTLRLVAGAAAASIPLSFWLLAFSMFMFLSLALVKRYAELFHVRAGLGTAKARGRGYFADDLPMVASLGAASGYMAVLVLALYINDARTTQLYRQPQVIWLACPLLLTWISRIWMFSHRGIMHEDPVVFAVRDRVSLAIGGLIVLVFWMAM